MKETRANYKEVAKFIRSSNETTHTTKKPGLKSEKQEKKFKQNRPLFEASTDPRKIILSQIPPGWKLRTVIQKFSEFGDIEDERTAPGKNSCIMLFKTEEQAKKAVEEMDGKWINS